MGSYQSGSLASQEAQPAIAVGTGRKMNKTLQSVQEHQSVVAPPGPSVFPLGSLESRAAARALAHAKSRNTRILPELRDAIADPLTWLGVTRAHETAIGANQGLAVLTGRFRINPTSHCGAQNQGFESQTRHGTEERKS